MPGESQLMIFCGKLSVFFFFLLVPVTEIKTLGINEGAYCANHQTTANSSGRIWKQIKHEPLLNMTPWSRFNSVLGARVRWPKIHSRKAPSMLATVLKLIRFFG